MDTGPPPVVQTFLASVVTTLRRSDACRGSPRSSCGCGACGLACSSGLLSSGAHRPTSTAVVRHRRPARALKSDGPSSDGGRVTAKPQSVIPLLHALVSSGGSDLHCKVGLRAAPTRGRPPAQAPGPGAAAGGHRRTWSGRSCPRSWPRSSAASHEADFAYSLSGVGRFRVNAYQARGTSGLVFRRVAVGAQTLVELGIPEVVGELALEPRGLVLVTGPTGSGKTTTLASLVDLINTYKEVNIITIEDPIEILHSDKKAIVSQREVRYDTADFTVALRGAMRQDPDVILVGEMRDTETVRAALSAAETGHLVMSTLHTIDVQETINRIIDFFPPHEQKQIRWRAVPGVARHRVPAPGAQVGRLGPGSGRRGHGQHRPDGRGDRRPARQPADAGPDRRGRVLQDADLRPAPVPTRPGRQGSRTTRPARSRRNAQDLTVALRGQESSTERRAAQLLSARRPARPRASSAPAGVQHEPRHEPVTGLTGGSSSPSAHVGEPLLVLHERGVGLHVAALRRRPRPSANAEDSSACCCGSPCRPGGGPTDEAA